MQNIDKLKIFMSELTGEIKKKKPSKDKLSGIKRKLCLKVGLKKIPTNIEVLLNTEKKDIPKIKKYLLTKPTRSLSGVSVVAVMSKPRKCPHGQCTMCPSRVDAGIPQSYTGKEPATRRALRNKFDPYLQVFNRLEQYVVTGHNFDKVELIVMGGTFPSFPKSYKEKFITDCFKAMNDFGNLFFNKTEFDITKFKNFFELPGNIFDEKRQKRLHDKILKIKNQRKTNLSKEQKTNETGNIRCVGLTIETRSDYGKLKQGNELLKLGCTRIELGIQSVYESALKKIKRGHSVKDNIESIKILKDLGFKLNFHYMPGLPGINRKEDLAGMKELFRNPDYKPDMLKIYPCMVVKDSKLYTDWKKGKFKPISTKEAADMIAKFKKIVPEYCRIMRVQRDIPTFMTEAGVDKTNLRQYVDEVIKEKKIECKCIRCREIGRHSITQGKIKIEDIVYEASEGLEFFIQAVKGNALLGFCRLRFPGSFQRKEITEDTAIIRELHVFGEAAEIGKSGKTKQTQHKGIGKMLMKRAEKIATNYYKRHIIVISAIGTREYYKKLGYNIEGPYMAKKIKIIK